MASAVILTYERKASFHRNASMRKNHNNSNGYSLDPVPPERSYTSETMADSSDTRRSRRPSAVPCTAQNFTTKSTEHPSETGSEDSCSLKRKSMSLNGNCVKDFISGLAVSLKDLSSSDKRQIRKRIKTELQHVRSLTQKLEAREYQVRSRAGINGSISNGHYVPGPAESSLREGPRFSKKPSVVIPDVNMDSMGAAAKDKRTPKANQLYVNSEFLSGMDKLPPFEKQKNKLPGGIKRALSGKLEVRDAKRPRTDASYNKKLSDVFKQCNNLLKKLMFHKFGWVFNEPVDAVKLGLHDYHKIIKKPMDFGTIMNKLSSGAYVLPTEFCDDMRLTFANAMKYNPQGHDVYIMAEILKGMFESKWRTLEEKVRELESAAEVTDAEPKDSYLPPAQHTAARMPGSVPTAASRPAPPSKKPKQPSVPKASSKVKSKPAPLPRRQMTFDEKQMLSDRLGSLTSEKLEQAIQIMRKNPNVTQTDDEIEVDIESFDTDTLWELHHLVIENSDTMLEEETPVQGQAVNVPEVSNGASKTPGPAHRAIVDAIEEEVDIGDEMPGKEFPPVIIEKDRDKNANAKHSSSSSSSSGSGSSSSDSDSGSSSGSDSEADDGHSPGAISKITSADKEPVGSAAVCDEKGFQADGLKRSPSPENALLRDDLASYSEGGDMNQERQARTALLRSRFAETILKAQEKTLPLSKDQDPEKLKKDQEDLERKRKEERARLQAEARATEIARRKAEVAAEAEAKRKRQAEREAARLALQNMEKTIEIGESMEVLKDLERLRSAPPEHVPSSGDETSPIRSPDGLSGFAFEGTNPLEKLGLFMRTDEEEQEEEEQEIDPLQAPPSSS